MVEPHYGRPDRDVDPSSYATIEEFWAAAYLYAEEFHPRELGHYRSVRIEDLEPRRFWSEYVWCVYTSGFNAKVLTPKFDGIMNAYGPWDSNVPSDWMWQRVSRLLANTRKFEAVVRTKKLMQSLGWGDFRTLYCSSIDALASLPFVGPITKFHLARNCGLDAVKEDIHLVRVADKFEFVNATAMCYFLAGLSDERPGVVDFVIWSFCAAYGSRGLYQ